MDGVKGQKRAGCIQGVRPRLHAGEHGNVLAEQSPFCNAQHLSPDKVFDPLFRCIHIPVQVVRVELMSLIYDPEPTRFRVGCSGGKSLIHLEITALHVDTVIHNLVMELEITALCFGRAAVKDRIVLTIFKVRSEYVDGVHGHAVRQAESLGVLVICKEQSVEMCDTHAVDVQIFVESLGVLLFLACKLMIEHFRIYAVDNGRKRRLQPIL